MMLQGRYSALLWATPGLRELIFTPASLFLLFLQPLTTTLTYWHCFFFFCRSEQCFVGDEALSKMDELAFCAQPIEYGTVINWEDMEKIWHHSFFNELRVDPEEHPVLLTECLFNSTANRERMTQIMFETFNVPAMHVDIQPIMSLYASGRTTGTIVQSGDGITEIAHVRDGYLLPVGLSSLKLGGRNLTDFLRKTLLESGHTLGAKCAAREYETAVDIKEKLAYVALDYDAEIWGVQDSSAGKDTYKLPDGNVLKLGSERFRVGEAMFQPRLIDSAASSIQDSIFKSLVKCDAGVRGELYANIVLSGGNTMFNGFAERLTKELTTLAPAGTVVKVVAPPERKYSSWIGCSILASLSTSPWVSKQEYDETGSNIVYRKTGVDEYST